jgi:hypothetical protein
MHSPTKLLFAALLLSLFLTSWTVDAAPSRRGRGRKLGYNGPRVLGGSTYRLRQFRNKKYKRTANSGTVALAKTYQKFNVPLPDSLANAIAGIVARLEGTGEIPLSNSTVTAGVMMG